jgi:hypothetical protein
MLLSHVFGWLKLVFWSQGYKQWEYARQSLNLSKSTMLSHPRL